MGISHFSYRAVKFMSRFGSGSGPGQVLVRMVIIILGTAQNSNLKDLTLNLNYTLFLRSGQFKLDIKDYRGTSYTPVLKHKSN